MAFLDTTIWFLMPLKEVFYFPMGRTFCQSHPTPNLVSATHLKCLELIQHSFLFWLACSSTQNSFNLGYDHLIQHFKVSSINSRFTQHDLSFIQNEFHGRLDNPQLLSNFHPSAPARRNRSSSLWHVPFARVMAVKNETFCRIADKCNELLWSCKSIVFFWSPSSAYRTTVRSYAARAGVYWVFICTLFLLILLYFITSN